MHIHFRVWFCNNTLWNEMKSKKNELKKIKHFFQVKLTFVYWNDSSVILKLTSYHRNLTLEILSNKNLNLIFQNFRIIEIPILHRIKRKRSSLIEHWPISMILEIQLLKLCPIKNFSSSYDWKKKKEKKKTEIAYRFHFAKLHFEANKAF